VGEPAARLIIDAEPISYRGLRGQPDKDDF